MYAPVQELGEFDKLGGFRKLGDVNEWNDLVDLMNQLKPGSSMGDGKLGMWLSFSFGTPSK